jgi:MFS family permease
MGRGGSDVNPTVLPRRRDPPYGARPVSAPPISPGYARYVLGVLFVVFVFNFVDRQILSILLEPIKADLGVSDTAMGFLTGIAFALFYTVAGIPIARWADTGNRRNVIVIGLAVWSAMTAVSGLVRTFGQLALARIGVGIGEAACSPPAHSLLADYFPPHRRATALAIYSMGIHVGILLGFVLGGWANQLFGWRQAFMIVGVPGLLLAVLVRLTVREPARGTWEATTAGIPTETVREVLGFVWGLRAFRHMALAAALHSFAGYAAATWGPAFLVRVHQMETGAIGTWLGLITGIGGAAGAVGGGMLVDRLGRRDPRWSVWIPAVACVLEVPFWIAFLLAPEAVPAMLWFIPAVVLGAMWLGPVFATTQGLVRPHMRALASALLLFVINLIGLGMGPQAVGILNDLFAPTVGAHAIRYSLLLVAVVNLWSALHFALAARTLRDDLGAQHTAQAA